MGSLKTKSDGNDENENPTFHAPQVKLRPIPGTYPFLIYRKINSLMSIVRGLSKHMVTGSENRIRTTATVSLRHPVKALHNICLLVHQYLSGG